MAERVEVDYSISGSIKKDLADIGNAANKTKDVISKSATAAAAKLDHLNNVAAASAKKVQILGQKQKTAAAQTLQMGKRAEVAALKVKAMGEAEKLASVKLKTMVQAEKKAVVQTKLLENRMVALNEKTKKTTNGFNLLRLAAGSFAAIIVGRVVKAAFAAKSSYESLNIQFETLLKSADAAKFRMQELAKFADVTPFQLKEVATASRVLETLTKGVMSTGDGLRLVGDAAAGTGSDFANLAMWVGRTYDGLQSNRPVGEAMMRMQELGLVSGTARNAIEELQKAGKGKEAWVVMRKQLERTKGAMEKLSLSGKGLASTFQDRLAGAFREILDGGLYEDTKAGLKGINDQMAEMIESGGFKRFGMVIGGLAKTFIGFTDVVATGIALLPSMFSEAAFRTESIWQGMWAKIMPFSKKHFNSLKEEADKNADYQKLVTDLIADDSKESYATLTSGISQLWKGLSGDIEATAEVAAVEAEKIANISGANGGKKKEKVDTDALDKERERLETLEEIRNEFSIRNLDEIGKSRAEALQALAAETVERYAIIGADQEARLMASKLFEDEKTEILKTASDARQKILDDEAKKEKEKQEMLVTQTGNMLGSLSSLFAAHGEKNKGFAIAAQALALGEAAVSTALGVSRSAEIGYPAAIPAVIASLATGATQMAAISAQSFATGGIVQGPITGDSVNVRANGGEMMLDAPKQRTMFDILSGKQQNQQAPTQFNITIGELNESNSDDVIDRLESRLEALAFRGSDRVVMA